MGVANLEQNFLPENKLSLNGYNLYTLVLNRDYRAKNLSPSFFSARATEFIPERAKITLEYCIHFVQK